MASALYNRGLKSILNGDVTLGTETIKALLVDSGYVLDVDHNVVNDLTPGTNELSGTGYVRKTLTSVTITQDDTNDRATLDAADITWSSINAGTADAMVLYITQNSDNDADNILLAYIDSGGFPSLTDGGDLTVQFNTAGILYI